MEDASLNIEYQTSFTVFCQTSSSFLELSYVSDRRYIQEA